MLGPALSWWFFFVIGSTVGSAILWRHRPNLAVGVCASIAILAPTWVTMGTEPFAFDIRLALACVMLIAYCFHPLGTLRYPQHWLDAAIGGIILSHIMSDVSKGGDFALVLIRATGEWAIPYLAGRCSVLFRGSVTWLAPWFSVTAIILGLGAVFESYSGINLWEAVFGAMDELVIRSREPRYGIIYRAVGPTRHPIFLGIIFLLLVPWTIAMIERSKSRWKRTFGWFALAMTIAGMISTVSRGPLLGLGIAGLTAACLRWPRLRPSVLLFGIVALTAIFFFRSEVIGLLEKSDTTGGRGKLVTVDDEAVVYTDTRNRLLVWKIYGPLLIRGGIFGYGTDAVSSFPPNIPGIPASARAAEILGVVDNSYLLVGLRFGLVGLVMFITVLIGAILTAYFRRRSAGLIFYPYGSAFLTALMGVLIGVGFEITTVFFSYEFGYWILFTCGVSAGLASLNRRLMSGATD